MVNWIVIMVLDILFSILGSLIVMWFSRQREFRADAGSAKYVGRGAMTSALQALARRHGTAISDNHASLATMKISGGPKSWFYLFASHPPLEDRIKALENSGR